MLFVLWVGVEQTSRQSPKEARGRCVHVVDLGDLVTMVSVVTVVVMVGVVAVVDMVDVAVRLLMGKPGKKALEVSQVRHAHIIERNGGFG